MSDDSTTTATVAVQYLSLDSSTPGELPYPVVKKDSGPKPLVVVDGDLTHRFGMAAQHVVIDKTWEIKNEGQADLVLTKGTIECNCTLAAFDGWPEGYSNVMLFKTLSGRES